MSACPYECGTTLAPLLVQPGEVRCTYDAGVVHQFGDREFRLRVISPRRQAGQVRLPNRVEQEVAGDSHSPAEDEELWVQYRAERCARLPEPATQLPECLQGAGVLSGDQGGNI